MLTQGGRSAEIRPRITMTALVPYHSMEAASLRETTEGGLCAAGVPLQHVRWTPGSTTCLPTHRPSAHSLARMPRELGGFAEDDGDDSFMGQSTRRGSTGRGSSPPSGGREPLTAVGAHVLGAFDGGVEEARSDLDRAERRCALLREAMLLAKERCVRAAARAARGAEPPPPPDPADDRGGARCAQRRGAAPRGAGASPPGPG